MGRYLGEGVAGGTEPRNLGKRTRLAENWREPVDGRAPRLGAREYIGGQVTRVGRFAEKDPLRTPRLWNRWRWLALGFWALVLGGSTYKAYRDLGGIPGLGDDEEP